MDLHEVTAGDCSELYYLDTGMFETSTYGAAYVLDADRPAVIETGLGTNHERILDGLDERGIDRADLEAIVVTHIHLDHAGGAGHLAEACPNAEIYVPEPGVDLLVDPGRLVAGTKAAVGNQWQYYVEPKPLPEDRVVPIADGDTIDLGDHELQISEAPGHAFHQVVFFDPANDAVFTGDAAGLWLPAIDTIHETSPPSDFDLEACLDDLETIRSIDPDVLLYTHFGPRDVGDDLDEALDTYATVLSDWVGAVEQKRAELGDDEAVIEHFAATTDLVEVWGEEKARAEVRLNTRGVLGYLDHRK